MKIGDTRFLLSRCPANPARLHAMGKRYCIAALVIAAGIFIVGECRADITILRCSFPGMEAVFFTRYSDDTPARVGVKPGIGNRAHYFEDRFGAQVFVEVNTDGTPVTMTTIERSLGAVHSRQYITPDGSVLAPLQMKGKCQLEKVR